GNAVAEGGSILKNAGVAFLGGLGDMMQRFGSAVIAQGIQLSIALKALSSLNAVAMIAAGAVIVGIGAALSSAASSAISSVQGGGGSGGGGSIDTNVSRPNRNYSSSAQSSGFDGGRVVFEIEGEKLVGVLRRTIQSNNQLGGQFAL